PASVKEATHQIAISSYVSIVERLRLHHRLTHSTEYGEDIRHYAYTICGTYVTVWVTTLETETVRRRSYSTYQVRKLGSIDLRIADNLGEFLELHRRVVTWGLTTYVKNYVEDLEKVMRSPGRQSFHELFVPRSAKDITKPRQEEGSANDVTQPREEG